MGLVALAFAQPADARGSLPLCVSNTAVAPSDLVPVALSPLAKPHYGAHHGVHQSAARSAASAQTGSVHSREIDERVRRAEEHQMRGHYRLALEQLRAGLALAEKDGDLRHVAILSGSLGSLYVMMGDAEAAEDALAKSRDLARRAGAAELEAVALNNLGNLYAERKDAQQALSAYDSSAHLALAAGQSALAARADINAARLLIRSGDSVQAYDRLARALRQLDQAGPRGEHALDLVAAALLFRELAAAKAPRQQSFELSYVALHRAAQVAEAAGDARAQSYALGYLGQLYENQDRTEEALRLTRRALFLAQTAHAPEALYLWQWQAGRLSVAQGELDAAIEGYKGAIRTLQSIRVDLSAFNPGTGESLFRKRVGGVFLELVDLLLKQAVRTRDSQAAQLYLIDARATMEQLKTAELEDYFRDDCVALLQSRIKTIDRLADRTAALYPVVLPDRIELLLSLPNGHLMRAVAGIPEEELARELHQFRLLLQNPGGSLRSGSRVLRHAQKLYDWLIKPIAAELTTQGVDTLVFVPDGALRSIPLAALHDGEEFMAAKYAIATTPGLTLLDPHPIARAEIRPLLGGLTKPVRGFDPLPEVEAELRAIREMYSSTTLADEKFVISAIEKNLDQVPYSVVHIASHAQFSSDPEKTFVLTFDGQFGLDELEQLLNPISFRNQPVELIVLSACETAAGDDRAALGLAGVAVKAGARSALATLWRVDDAAAARLVAEFYHNLSDRRLSKAQALQRAQMSLLQGKDFKHPYYWAPYLIIGSWL